MSGERVNWRWVTLGDPVWAPYGLYGWRAAIVAKLGKRREDLTVVGLAYLSGGRGRRHMGELLTRDPVVSGRDKPPPRREAAQEVSRP